MYNLVVLFIMESGNQPVTLNFATGELRLEAIQRIRNQATANCRGVEFYY